MTIAYRQGMIDGRRQRKCPFRHGTKRYSEWVVGVLKVKGMVVVIGESSSKRILEVRSLPEMKERVP